VTANAAPEMKKSDRERVLSQIKEIGVSVFKTDVSSLYERYEPDVRIRMIGSCLENDPHWLDRHPKEAAFVAEQGIDAAECTRRFVAWYERKRNWKPVGGIGGGSKRHVRNRR